MENVSGYSPTAKRKYCRCPYYLNEVVSFTKLTYYVSLSNQTMARCAGTHLPIVATTHVFAQEDNKAVNLAGDQGLGRTTYQLLTIAKLWDAEVGSGRLQVWQNVMDRIYISRFHHQGLRTSLRLTFLITSSRIWICDFLSTIRGRLAL